MFVRAGLPERVVSDNSPQFGSEEFQQFMKKNGIRRITSAPCHPTAKGLVERFVQTLKQVLRSMTDQKGSLQKKLPCFLLAYRNAVHATMNQTSAMLLIGQSLRSRLDLLKPELHLQVRNHQIRQAPVGGLVHIVSYKGWRVIIRDPVHGF